MTDRDRLIADAVLLTDREVAELLRIGRSSVWRAVAEGSLPAPVQLSGVKGKRWRLREIRAYVEGLK